MGKILKKLNYVENLNLFISRMQSSNWIEEKEPEEPLIKFNETDTSFGFVLNPNGMNKTLLDNWLSHIEIPEEEGFKVLMKDTTSEENVRWGVLVYSDEGENCLYVVTTSGGSGFWYSPSTGWIYEIIPIVKKTVFETQESVVLTIDPEFSVINGTVLGNNIK